MHHQRLLHQRDQRALAPVLGVDLAAGDRKRAAGFDHEALGHEALADGGCEQVQLELDGQHRRVRRKQREARVTAGGIDDRADDPGVDVAVLLRYLRSRNERNRAITRPHVGEDGADQAHCALPREARAHALREFGIERRPMRQRRGTLGGVGHGGAVGAADACRNARAGHFT